MNQRIWRRRVGTVLTLLAFCLSLLPLGSWSAAAEKGSAYTTNQTVAARLDIVFATYGPGTYFTYNGKPCTDHNTNPNCATTARGCNCRRVLDDGADMLAWQCFGYARYVFYTCFGFIDSEWANPGKFYSLGSIEAGKLTEANVKNLLTQAKTGAHIRLSGHSLAVLSTSANGVTVIHANVDGQCGVTLQTFSWKQFVSAYQWQGIEYVNMPKTYPAGGTTPPPPTLPTVTTKNVEEGVYTLQNLSTGRLLQVKDGKDANETPLTTGTAVKDSKAQQFRLQYKDNGRYYLGAMCSSNGNDRVADVIRDGRPPSAGDKLEIYKATDPDAQLFRLVKLADGTYALEIAASKNIVIADQPTAGTQLTLQTYADESIQKWRLVRVAEEPLPAAPVGVYTVMVDEGSVLNIRGGASTAYAITGKIPNGAVVPVTKLSNGWGYTTYNGVQGWVSLDYANRACGFGDMHGRDSIKVDDALLILKGTLHQVTFTRVQQVAADVDLDGQVTIFDALKVLQYRAGKITNLVPVS